MNAMSRRKAKLLKAQRDFEAYWRRKGLTPAQIRRMLTTKLGEARSRSDMFSVN